MAGVLRNSIEEPDDVAAARYRVRNAVAAINDALIELRVAKAQLFKAEKR
jgi:hypothetical protein